MAICQVSSQCSYSESTLEGKEGRQAMQRSLETGQPSSGSSGAGLTCGVWSPHLIGARESVYTARSHGRSLNTSLVAAAGPASPVSRVLKTLLPAPVPGAGAGARLSEPVSETPTLRLEHSSERKGAGAGPGAGRQDWTISHVRSASHQAVIETRV